MSDQNTALFDKLDGLYVTKLEHDWLERRFYNMTEKEKILFQGAMELEKPQEIGQAAADTLKKNLMAAQAAEIDGVLLK